MEKSLIDAEKVIRDLTAMKKQLGVDAILIDAMIDGLKRQPKVDAVEVVRCKDCRYFTTKGYEKAGEEDLQIGYCACNLIDAQACQFCSCGERSGDNAVD